MKKLFACLLSLVMLSTSLAACSGGASSSNENSSVASTNTSSSGDNVPVDSGEKIPLSFWYWADNAEQSNVMQAVVKGFNESNDKNIVVTAEEYPWDGGKFTDSILTANMGGGGPDMSMFKVVAGPVFSANELLVDLSSYINAWEDKDQIPESLWDTMQKATNDGTTSLVPFSVEALYFYYRPSYFEKAGVEVPKTWEEFLEACKKCTMDTNGDGKTDVYGFGLRGSTGGADAMGSFLYAYGGSWEDMTTPETIKGYQAYIDLFKNGYAPEASPNVGYAEMIDGFKTGLTAMIIHHIASSSMWVEAFGDDVGAFVSPTGPNGDQWTCLGETELAVYKNCKNPDAAFEFIKYMTVGKGGAEWFTGSGKGLPSTEVVQATTEYKDNRFMQYATDAVNIAGIMPMTDTTTEFINTTFPSTNQQALLGQITAEEAMKIMNESLNGK